MKKSPASLLTVLSLALALCACDSGDKKEDGAAPKLPPKKDKPVASSSTAPANPAPPEPTETSKDMNAPVDASGSSFGKSPTGEVIDPGVIVLQQAVGKYRMQNAMKSGGLTGGPSNPNIKQTPSKAAAKTLTSLDQLVNAGIIKSIPEAPAGKKYVLDTKTQTVKLENK